MNDYIEYALIDVGPDVRARMEAVEMDPKDRHVLAAAVSAEADILLTDNTRHFHQGPMAERKPRARVCPVPRSRPSMPCAQAGGGNDSMIGFSLTMSAGRER